MDDITNTFLYRMTIMQVCFNIASRNNFNIKTRLTEKDRPESISYCNFKVK